MSQQTLSKEEIGHTAQKIYEETLRAVVETPENIGKILVLDVETSEYAIDDMGIETALHFREKRPDAALFAIRIGYKTLASFNGVLERTAS